MYVHALVSDQLQNGGGVSDKEVGITLGVGAV